MTISRLTWFKNLRRVVEDAGFTFLDSDLDAMGQWYEDGIGVIEAANYLISEKSR